MVFQYRNLTKEERWVSRYEALVKTVVSGYEEMIYEYTNDLTCRLFIQEGMDQGNNKILLMMPRIKHADEQFKKLLQPTKDCIHGDYPKSFFWFWGIPKNSKELMKEAELCGWV